MEKLEKELKEKKAVDEASEYERVKREVKEEAQKTEVNTDLLHEKLVTLENFARRTNHANKEKLNMILGRFHAHKSRPSFVAALVLKLVSSKDEETILEKEQKLMKHFGIDLKEKVTASSVPKDAINTPQAQSYFPVNWGYGGYVGMPPFTTQPMSGHMPYPMPSFLPPVRPSSAVGPRNQRYSSPIKECFRCRRTGHMVKNCPLN